MFQRKQRIVVLDWGLALLVGVLLVTPVFAAEESKELLKTGEEAILAALEEKTSFEFIEEPLDSVIDHFREVHGIEIQIDCRALQDVNMGTDTPITKCIQNVTFRSALNLVLHDLDLTWVIRDEVMMITTPEEAELQLIRRVYDVAQLVTVQDLDGNRWQDFGPLIRAVTTTVAPESWQGVGGPGSIAELEYRGAVVLIIRQTHEVQEQVVDLLEELSQFADQHGEDKYPTREKRPPQPMRGFPGMMGGMGGGGMGGAEAGGFM